MKINSSYLVQNLNLFTEMNAEQSIKTSSSTLYELCFPEQINFILSTVSRYKVALCSRRAGKSTGVGHGLVHYATIKKNSNCLYLTKTRETAKRIIWDILKEIIPIYGHSAKFNETELTVYFPHFNSYIFLKGMGDLGEMEKIRGQKFRLAVIDEAQMFSTMMSYLIDEILGPALLDLAGQLWLTGTPPPSCAGFFVDSYRNDAWDRHHWTMKDNKYFIESVLNNSKTAKCFDDIIEEEITRRKISITHPSIRRELFGELVRSDDMLVYKYQERLQDFPDLPDYKWKTIIGIDLGFSDSDAIVAIGFSTESDDVYLLEEFKKNKLGIDSLAAKIQYFKDKYHPIAMVIDEGGLGKKINQHLSEKYAFAIEAADKQQKFMYVEFMNSDLLLGKIKIKKESKLADEMVHLTYNESLFNVGKREEDEYYDNHLCDAFLYAYRYSYHYRYKEPQPSLLSFEDLDELKAMQSHEKRSKRALW